MSEQSWRPLFRTPKATVTRALHSPAFAHSRERAWVIVTDPAALRELADVVEAMDHANAPLAAITDRVGAAVRFLRAKADRLDGSSPDSPQSRAVEPHPDPEESSVSSAARERLVVAGMHYLVTPVDLVPDFVAGGYIDDVLLLSWVFGAAANELEPFLDD